MSSTHDSLVLYDVVGVVALEEEGAAVAPMRANHRRHSHAHQVLWSIMCSKYSKNLAVHW